MPGRLTGRDLNPDTSLLDQRERWRMPVAPPLPKTDQIYESRSIELTPRLDARGLGLDASGAIAKR